MEKHFTTEATPNTAQSRNVSTSAVSITDSSREPMDWQNDAQTTNNVPNLLPSSTVSSSHGASVYSKSMRKSIVSAPLNNQRDDDDHEPQCLVPDSIHNDTSLYNSYTSKLETDGYQSNPIVDLDADAAYALQLQKEEYSRDTFMPFGRRNNAFTMNGEGDTATALDIPSDQNLNGMNDAEYASYLQEQENYRASKMQSARVIVRPQRQTSTASQRSHTDETVEVVPMPPFYRFSRPTNPDADNDSGDDSSEIFPYHPIFQLLSNRGRSMDNGASPFIHFFRGASRRQRGNLQNSTDDFGPEDYERLLQLDDTIHKKKLTSKQIDDIPTEKYKPSQNQTEEENRCGICLENYEENQILRRFSCEHVYHRECADRWLKESNVCPICRKTPVVISAFESRQHRGGAYHNRSSHPRGNLNNRTQNNRGFHNSKESRHDHQS